MLRPAVVIASVMLSLPVYADSFHVAVQYDCNTAEDLVAVYCLGA